MRWLKGGSKADANVADEGLGAKGQEEQIEEMVLDGNKMDANIADGDQGSKGQEEQVEGMVFKVGGKY